MGKNNYHEPYDNPVELTTVRGGGRELSIEPVGRSMYRGDDPRTHFGGHSQWMEPDQRPIARKAKADIDAFLAGLTRAQLANVLWQLGAIEWQDIEYARKRKVADLRVAVSNALHDRLIVPTRANGGAAPKPLIEALINMAWDVGDQGRDGGWLVVEERAGAAPRLWHWMVEGWGRECVEDACAIEDGDPGSQEELVRLAGAGARDLAGDWANQHDYAGYRLAHANQAWWPWDSDTVAVSWALTELPADFDMDEVDEDDVLTVAPA